MTWLASSWIGNLIPSSEEKDAIGDSVPDVRTIHRVWEPISEKTCESKKQSRHSRRYKLGINLLHWTKSCSSNYKQNKKKLPKVTTSGFISEWISKLKKSIILLGISMFSHQTYVVWQFFLAHCVAMLSLWRTHNAHVDVFAFIQVKSISNHVCQVLVPVTSAKVCMIHFSNNYPCKHLQKLFSVTRKNNTFHLVRKF